MNIKAIIARFVAPGLKDDLIIGQRFTEVDGQVRVVTGNFCFPMPFANLKQVVDWFANGGQPFIRLIPDGKNQKLLKDLRLESVEIEFDAPQIEPVNEPEK